MSDKKVPGTSLVPLRIEPIDHALVPKAGHYELALIEGEQKEALRAFGQTAGLTIGLGAVTALGLFVSALVPLSSPYFFLAALLMVSGFVGAITGSAFSTLSFFRLVRANRMRLAPPGEDLTLARMEGVAHALIDAWNGRAERWEEGWLLLEKEERDLFALQDRCVSKKSRGGLVRRIELVRKEKRKHLRVRAKLDLERERILAGVESIRKHLPPPGEPLYLTGDDDDAP